MSLLTPPADGSTMRQVRRYGIGLDACPAGGDVWRNKGKVERLMTPVSDEVSESRTDRACDRRHRGEEEDDFDFHRSAGGGRRLQLLTCWIARVPAASASNDADAWPRILQIQLGRRYLHRLRQAWSGAAPALRVGLRAVVTATHESHC